MIFGKSINKYYLKYSYMFLIGLIALVVIDYLQLEIPGLLSGIIENLTAETMDSIGLVETLKEIGLFVIIIIIGRFTWRLFIFGASRQFDYGLRNDMFKHAEKLSAQFYSENKTGGLMAYFTNDLEAVRQAVGPGMIMFVDTVFLGGLALYRMAELDLMLMLYSAIPLFFISALGIIVRRKIRSKFKDAQKAFEELSDITNESLSGIDVIKAFVKEESEIKEFLKINKNAKDKNVEYVRVQARFNLVIRTVVTLIYVLILGVGAYIVQTTAGLPAEEQFTVGELVEFYLLFGTLVWPMMAFARIIDLRNRGKGSLERIERILNEKVDVFDDEKVLNVKKLKGDIEFKNVTFRYPDADYDVLKNVTFKVSAGQTIAILGRTGSGKTSIVDLLLRIYNVNPGTILLDGLDIMKLPLKTVRNGIGYVPQDGFLFSDTIKNNISLSFEKNDELMNEVETAARLSDVHDNIIEFTDGYETIIGERGVTLSGGQRQRVSIARALIKNAPIMILDDSVSAVDTKTEETILENLKEKRVGKTTVIIAHRITTIKNADKIIIVNEGQVLDVGTHAELLSRCDFYQDMVERQRLEDEMEVL